MSEERGVRVRRITRGTGGPAWFRLRNKRKRTRIKKVVVVVETPDGPAPVFVDYPDLFLPEEEDEIEIGYPEVPIPEEVFVKFSVRVEFDEESENGPPVSYEAHWERTPIHIIGGIHECWITLLAADAVNPLIGGWEGRTPLREITGDDVLDVGFLWPHDVPQFVCPTHCGID